MSNQTARNPWIIDTTSATAIFKSDMRSVQYEYVDYTSATDRVEIQDRDGHIIARLQGASDLRTVRTGKVGWVYGLLVPVRDTDNNLNLPSGKVIVYFE